MTSRIHVHDLARLLVALTGPQVPGLVVGCDERPARTVEVAAYTCELLGRPMPPIHSKEEALAGMSSQAREMRTAGRRCRSLHREALIGALRYPSYREGMRDALGEDPES